MDRPRGDADEAGPRAGAGVLGVGLVDVAEEVDVGAALQPAVRVALVGEPPLAEGMVGEDEDELPGAVGAGQGGREGGVAERPMRRTGEAVGGEGVGPGEGFGA